MHIHSLKLFWFLFWTFWAIIRFLCLRCYFPLSIQNIKKEFFFSKKSSWKQFTVLVNNLQQLLRKYQWWYIRDIFPWILRNFQEHLFYRTPPVAASESICRKYPFPQTKNSYEFHSLCLCVAKIALKHILKELATNSF